MRIKTQLTILFISAILTVLAFAVSMVTTEKAIDRAIVHSRQAYNLAHKVSVLHRVASELTQDNYIRVEKQWDIVMRDLQNDLESQPHRAEKFTEHLKVEETKANFAFREAVLAYKNGGLQLFGGDYRKAQYFSRTHLALILNNLVATANDMAQDSYEYIDKIRSDRTTILSAIGIINILFITVWLSFFWRTIMNPLRKLLKAIQVVSTGDLSHRVQVDHDAGDMHTLINSFNDMLNRLQTLTVSRKRLLDATENERSRIGRELHDGISQTLVGARYKLEMLTNSNINQEKQRDAVLSHLAQAELEIQSIVKDLHPAMLEDLGLVEALRWFGKNNSNGSNINLAFGLTEQEIPHELHIPIYRIVQEATNNAQRHGNALNIHIQMNRQIDTINLFIEDDGKGFTPSRAKLGNGLVNIRERVANEGGELTIDSSPGRGCSIIASFSAIRE
ncbi:HAMP domain-containing protein [uncultured Pseudodesulfovibrio sp.]|uniref:sensor histidine kinase n=1 Tax=uncultured Pseudodesulfovibrio sp. TaxID=2035858 RepID=UPI0029C8F1B1|nr:HAMP domain-containing protein [uncultured Pseudodesulfovibrio sp.]